MNLSIKQTIIQTLAVAVGTVTALFAFVISVQSVHAQSPANCLDDVSVVNIGKSTAAAESGETITFTVEAGNPADPDGCDITDRTLTLTLPDGTIVQSGPANYPIGTPISTIMTENYVADAAHLTGNSWTATVSWDGTQEDGFESPSTGSKQSSVVYVPVELDVTKTANTAYTETYEWTIEKMVDPDSHIFFDGQSGSSDYDVTVTKGNPIASDFEVTGTITIHNPAEFVAASITGVSDTLDDGTPVVVDCGVTFPHELAAGATLECSYSAEPDDQSATLNEVDVTTSGDVAGGSGQANVDWGEAEVTEVNGTINVTDSVEGALGSASETTTFEYSQPFDCSAAQYVDGHWQMVYPNTATIDETQQSDDASVTVDCYLPTVTKTAVPAIEEGYRWTIDKSVSPATWDLFDGDSGTSEYTVAVTKELASTGYSVSGGIAITNPAPIPLPLASVVDTLPGSSNMDVDCDLSDIPADSVRNCTYSTDHDGSNETNTVTVEFGGDINPAEGTADVDYAGVNPTVTGGEIDVEDTNGMNWQFSDSGEVSYDRTFVCGDDGGTHDNTATIVQTGASDDASVTVNCYDLTVEKTAEGSFDRSWDWTIEKTADQSNLELENDENATVNYEVTVDATPLNGDGMVSGTITITNNHPTLDADLVDVTDNIGPVNCPADVVPAGGQLVCTYGPVSTDAEINVATAEQQNYDYDDTGAATAAGTMEYEGQADIEIGLGEETDECIDVNDTLGGFLGTVCAGVDTLPYTFKYSLDFGVGDGNDIVLEECSEGEEPNIADFITNDTGATGNDDWLVSWAIECQMLAGCTPGYWKNNWWSEDDEASPMYEDSFSTHFGEMITIKWADKGKPSDVLDPILLQALDASGGGINALARHATAALLNASFLESMSDYMYPLTTGEIITMVQGAIANEDYEEAKNILAGYNELGCSLDAHGNSQDVEMVY